MSFELYSKWWACTRQVLEELVPRDADFVKATDTQIKDRYLASHLVGGLYSKYCMLVQDLGTILDQMAQPQKRMVVRKLMDSATVRLHELSEELRNIDISEFHYVDGALVELKLVPHDVQILDPIFYYLREYTIEELWTKIKNGEKIYVPPPPEEPEEEQPEGEETAEGAEKAEGEGKKEEPEKKEEGEKKEEEGEEGEKKEKKKKEKKKYVPEVKVLTEEELAELLRKAKFSALMMTIQVAERGRQARIYFAEKWDEYQFKQKIRLGLKQELPSPEKLEYGSLHIEKLWRGHCARELMKRREQQRRFLIGMYEPSWKSHEVFDKLEENLQTRRDLRDKRIKEYIEANLNERERVFRVIGPRLMEDISDEIREWFHQWYTEVKNFDKYPPEEKGGTVLVVRGETMTPKQWLDDVEANKKKKAKDKGKEKEKKRKEKEKLKKMKAEAKKKEKEKAKKEKERKKKKKMKPWDFELEYEQPTVTREPFEAAFKEFHDTYDERPDEENPEETHYFDMIHEEKCCEMQLELRVQVDEMMRLELDLLQEALLKDRAKAKGKKYKAKKKKNKKKKKKGKKGKKDPTGNRSIEDLFQELVDNDIIQPYEKHYLREYKGDFSYNNWDLRRQNFDPPATLGDVRQAVKLNCIAPLSTERMIKPKSVLILGPRQSGKHILANAVFTESQSVLFNLSPENVVGKYPGGKGMKMLLHLIDKMSRILQPSVIYLDRSERTFYKKVPKEEKELEPKKMGSKMKKIVKGIKPEDRVMVFGVCGRPWMAQGKMKKIFERIILIPRPDYGSVYLYWRELLMPYHGVDRNINLSCLAKLTVNYPLPVLKGIVEKVLTAKRIMQLSYNPLKQAELYEELIDVEPITDKEYKKFLKFCKKDPLMKERNRLNKYFDKIRAQEEKAKQKK